MVEKSGKIVNKYLKEAIIEIFVVFSISFILYIIEESSTNIVVSLFDATKYRLKLDFKNLMISTYIYTFFNFCIKEYREENLWTAISIKLISQAVLYIATLNIYRYMPLFKKFWILILVIIIAQVIEKLSFRYLKTTNKIDEIFKYINIFLVIIFSIYCIFC